MRESIGQFLRFGIVGALAFVIDYGILMLLSQTMGVDPVVAAAISFVAATVFNYLVSMRYVFRHRQELSVWQEFAMFVILSVVGLGINELCMWTGTTALGTGPMAVTLTKLVATVVVMFWNFLSRRRWLDATTSE